MGEEELTKRVYKGEIGGTGVRGRPPVRWINRVEEYCRERNDRGVNGLQRAKRACLDRARWRGFCRGHPLEGVPQSE